jgi:CrcB protein
LNYLWIGLGSALGGMGRYSFPALAARWIGETFPWGTLWVNVLGSFFIGLFATLVSPEDRLFVPASARQLVMVGRCGGFTTFSTLSLETLNLARDGQWIKAAGNILGTFLLCLVGVWGGHALATLLNER